MQKIDIVACLDKGFVMPTAVMMYSVCINNKDIDIDFHIVIDESVTEVDQNNIVRTISGFSGKKSVFYKVTSQLTASFPLFKGIHITKSAYYRLYLSEILPETIEKILYLDGDIIVRHSLLTLWNTELTDYAIGATIDWAEGLDETYDRLCYPRQKRYFNTGVMLINLSYWRSNNLVEKFVDYTQKYPERIKYVDQDVLNVILLDKIYLLPIKYNFQTGFLRDVSEKDLKKVDKETRDSLNDPIIVHFTEGRKPWLANVHHPHPYCSTFYKYQKQTIYWNKQKKFSILRQMLNKTKWYLADFLRFTRIIEPIKTFHNIKPID